MGKPETYITKKKLNRKNTTQEKRIKHFRKRRRRLDLAKGLWTTKGERERWLRKELLFEKNYYQNQKQEPDDRSLEERAKAMRKMKNKVIDTTQMELAWSKFAREQRDNNRKHRVVLHTGEEL